MIAGFAIKAVLGKVAAAIPWKYIIIAGLAAGLFFGLKWGVNHYATLVSDNTILKADRDKLTSANHLLEARNKEHIAALEQTIKQNQKRESDYAKNIRIIEGQKNGNACVNSPAVIESLRLRVERRNARSLRSQ
jgi:hypothetical protein